jgi:hypothetical protein
LFALSGASLAQDGGGPDVEREVKASLAFNFLHFVTFPDDAGAETLPLCVVGEDAYGAILSTLEGRVAQGRSVAVRRFEAVSDPEWRDACTVVLSSSRDNAEARALLAAAAGRPILTIGESTRFAELGGIVQYEIAGGTVQFQINNVVGGRARLTISSKLLRLASRVVEN